MDNNYVLKLNDVEKVYPHPSGQNIFALENISLNIPHCSFTVIYGVSGSGKSTLLKVTGLIEAPTNGSVILSGKHTEKISAKKKSNLIQNNIGFILQRSNLLKYLNVLENVMLPMQKGSKNQARDLLNLMGLNDYKQCPQQLTSLDNQKVALARALINQPLLVLADEPTGDLNKKDSKEFLKLLMSFKTKTSILMATDNPKFVKYADIALKLENGKLNLDY